MAISHCYWHLVVKHGNCTLLLASSGEEWQFCTLLHCCSHLVVSRKAISHCYWYLVFRVNLLMCNLKSIILEKWAPFQRVSTHIYGVSMDIDCRTFIFRVNLGMSSLIFPCLRLLWGLFWGFQHTFIGFPRSLGMGKHSVFRVNLGMWPLQKLIVSENHRTCCEGFNTHLLGFQGDRWESIQCIE